MSAIKQSISYWCVADRGLDHVTILAGAAKIGFKAVDLIDEKLWPLVHQHGLSLAAVNGHASLDDGLNRGKNADRIEQELRANIAKAQQWKIPALICFSGRRHGGDEETDRRQCADTLKKVAPVAEAAGVTLVVELLNSKVDHPEYQCDHTAWGVQLCERVNSPAVKLLYDIYHMQIMEGDLIRTIEANHQFFGHYHTAGNPGRGQPDETQEIYYPAVYRAIAKTGYQGYIAHEFLPKGDPLKAMEKAFKDCEAAVGKA